MAFDLVNSVFISELDQFLLDFEYFFIATSGGLQIMLRAVDNKREGIPNLEVTPLVNFLVNNTDSSAAELEELRRTFNETVAPIITDMQQPIRIVEFYDGDRDIDGELILKSMSVSPINVSL